MKHVLAFQSSTGFVIAFTWTFIRHRRFVADVNSRCRGGKSFTRLHASDKVISLTAVAASNVALTTFRNYRRRICDKNAHERTILLKRLLSRRARKLFSSDGFVATIVEVLLRLRRLIAATVAQLCSNVAITFCQCATLGRRTDKKVDRTMTIVHNTPSVCEECSLA